MIKRILGAMVCFGIAWLIFYGFFYKLTPWICKTIPNGPWHDFVTTIVYVAVGYFGGIGIPLGFVVTGIIFLMED